MCLYHYDRNCKHSEVEICKLLASQRWLDSNTNDIQRNRDKISSVQGLIFHLCCGIGKQDAGWQLELLQLLLLEGSHAPRYNCRGPQALAATPRALVGLAVCRLFI